MKMININQVEPKKLQGRDVFFLVTPGNMGCKNVLIGYTVVYPGKDTRPAHSHIETEEVYLFIRGNGVMVIDSEEREVGP